MKHLLSVFGAFVLAICISKSVAADVEDSPYKVLSRKMSEILLPTYAYELLNQISKDNGFKNYSIQVNPGSRTGDGFTSKILSVKITDNHTKKELHLVCKLAPQWNIEDFFSEFDRETTFYNEIMPTFVKFQEEKHLSKGDQFQAYPKCYAAICDTDKEEFIIILEDLRTEGFRMWNRSKVAPIELMRLLMREIGKFHGISIAMKDQKPGVFAVFQRKTDSIHKLYTVSEPITREFIGSFDRAIESLKRENHKNVMRHIKYNFASYFNYLLTRNNRYAVIGHGDLWINNILPRFNEKNIVEDIRILDWQLVEYVSPAIDLSLSLFTCIDKAIRDKEYVNLLKLYYESVSKTVKLLGSDPDELFTFDDLQDEFKKFGTFALTIAPIAIETSLADVSEQLNQNESDDNEANGELVFHLNKAAKSEYERRLNEVFEDVVDKLGYYFELV